MEKLHGLYAGWSRPTQSAWAKLDNDPTSAHPLSLSLVAHLADAATTAHWMWSHFISASVRRQLSGLLGGEDAARSAVVFSAGVHDIGKLTPPFAVQAKHVGQWEVPAAMERAGLRIPTVRSNVKHALLGQVIVEDWLRCQHSFSLGIARTIAVVTGGHHGQFPSKDELEMARHTWWALGDAEQTDPHVPTQWHRCRVEILERVSDASGASAHWATWRHEGWPVEAQMLISGIVILADWLSSNVDFFPYGEAEAGRLEAALPHINLPATWNAQEVKDLATLFTQRFPQLATSGPSPLQTYAVRCAKASPSASLMIVEAPMGAGKTEAALLAAETLAAKFGAGGVFIGLPTMATANPMFDRVLEWLENTLTTGASVTLAHSKAMHHDRFQGLLQRSKIRSIHGEENGDESNALAASWLTGRKKSTQASFVVGTVDQLLLMALQAKHVSLRHLAMSGKVVVIDEVHAADTYMRVYLRRALVWLARMGTSVILLSATLPPAQRHEFVDAYAEGLGLRIEAPQESTDYPLITMVSDRVDYIPVPADPGTSQVRFLPIPDDSVHLVSLLQDQLAEGGCAAIIRNTVGRAQEIYEELTRVFPGEVVLHHSRFIPQHRTERERELVDSLGRAGTRPYRKIIVGTQVLEQSLDVDFDMMVSDLAPMDLLLQRAGRLHRHKREHRPRLLTNPTVYVTGADFSIVPPAPDRGSTFVYGEEKLLRAASILGQEGLSATFPADIPILVRDAYSPDKQPPPGWEEVWSAAEMESLHELRSKTDRASHYLIHSPDDRESLVDSNKFDALDPESPRSRGKQQVRDAMDSLEVIVLVRSNDGSLGLPDGIDPLSREIHEYAHADIADDLARLMSTCTISLPLVMTYHFDEVEEALSQSLDYSNWDRSHWLKGQLALVLDSNGSATVGRFHLTYDAERGLMHSAEEPTS